MKKLILTATLLLSFSVLFAQLFHPYNVVATQLKPAKKEWNKLVYLPAEQTPLLVSSGNILELLYKNGNEFKIYLTHKISKDITPEGETQIAWKFLDDDRQKGTLIICDKETHKDLFFFYEDDSSIRLVIEKIE
jgi:hypothetical protein